jgi:uncharacterized membrane protein YhaH (DUF805 family)
MYLIAVGQNIKNNYCFKIMGLNRTLLNYTIIFNLINGLLLIYATTSPGGEVGMQMYFGFPLFYLIGLIGLITIGLKNKKDFEKMGNWILAIFCTPIPTLIVVLIIVGPTLQ